MNHDLTDVFMTHIRENAIRYFKVFRSTHIDVSFEGKQERPASILYQFSISSDSQNRTVLVKVPLYRGTQGVETDDIPVSKPDLYPKTEVNDNHKLGFTALKSISDYFTSLGEENFGAVRVLDYLPEHKAIVTEASEDSTLRTLFLKTSRFRPRIQAAELEQPFRNAGKWLRLYHEMSKEDNVQTRMAHRHEYIEAVNTLTSFLTQTIGNQAFFQEITAKIEKCAFEVLPPLLPLGLGHGDFAMRNILVGPEARISVIDTFAKWRTPIYEDIGYFLNALKRSAPQVISQGLVFNSAQLATYERVFLEGYFEQNPIPYREIRLYEMLSLLDKWSSVVVHSRMRGKKFKNFSALKTRLANRYLKKSTQSLLSEISGRRSSDFAGYRFKGTEL